MRRILSVIVLAVMVAGLWARAEDWFQEIEVTSEQTVDNKIDYTIRFMPQKSHLCSTVVFKCIYRQKFPWEDVRGKKYLKIHEPVSFIYKRTDEKMVHDLDHYISFRVPYGLETLVKRYGPKVFNNEAAVTVPRIEIEGLTNGVAAWKYTIPVDTKLDSQALAKQASEDDVELLEE